MLSSQLKGLPDKSLKRKQVKFESLTTQFIKEHILRIRGMKGFRTHVAHYFPGVVPLINN